MKHIVAIFTGGTIGSKKSDSGEISPDRGMSYRLLEEYKKIEKRSGEEVEFFPVEPYFILSENLTGKELLLLAQCVNRYLPAKEKRCIKGGSDGETELPEKAGVCRQPDGILIMHGTDTLQYSAAFLSLLFGNVSLPILFVSSAYPLEDERANGLRNFSGAVRFICERQGRGVFVSYANEGETVKIHSGDRLVRSVEYSADVTSSCDQYYGSYTKEGHFLKNPMFPAKKDAWTIGTKDPVHLTEDCRGVLRIAPYVGMVYPDIPSDTKVILMESYHSGTIGILQGLRKFAKEAKKRKIPVYLTGLNREDTDYETVKGYTELGILPLRNQTAIFLYMKLWLFLSSGIALEENIR